MGTPKITKPSELRADLYKNLGRVAKGEKLVVPTKEGEVIILSKAEYDAMIEDQELMREFDEPIKESELVGVDEALTKLAKKHGLSYESRTLKKSRKKSR